MNQNYYPQPSATPAQPWGHPPVPSGPTMSSAYPAATTGPSTVSQNEDEDKNRDIIAKAAVKGKFLDFRNNLIPANVANYAMIHGIGGKKYAPRSTIKIFITDYAVQDHIKVNANVSPEVIANLLIVCEKNTGLPQQPSEKNPAEQAAPYLQTAVSSPLPVPLIPQQLQGQQCVAVPVNALQMMEPLETESAEVARLLQLAKTVPALPNDGQGIVYVPVPLAMVREVLLVLKPAPQNQISQGGTDFSYRQERVHKHLIKDGKCPVQVLTISRTGLRKNGEISRLPWTVNISNFMAAPVEQKGGMTSYNSRTISDKRDAFVSISDFEMFRCLYRVNRFIELWEMAYGIPLLKEGIAARNAARQQQNG